MFRIEQAVNGLNDYDFSKSGVSGCEKTFRNCMSCMILISGYCIYVFLLQVALLNGDCTLFFQLFIVFILFSCFGTCLFLLVNGWQSLQLIWWVD